MARQEQDREDLYAEAIACRERAEIIWPAISEPVLLGWREDGRADCFFGADPVYHFDHQGQLRRAYVGGKLYRTQGETLAELTRERTPTQTVLARIDLSREQCEEFREQMFERIRHLQNALAEQTFTLLRGTLTAAELRDRGAQLCQQVLEAPRFLAPRFPGKR